MARKFERFDSKYMTPDPVYDSELAAKFINAIMVRGEKAKAQSIFYDAVDYFKKNVELDEEESVVDGFEKAVEYVKPKIEVRSRRVGGATYQVPMEVPPRRKISLALRWIMESARSKRSGKGIPIHRAIGEELVDAYNQEGSAIQQRRNVHRMAEANKAFAHLAW